MERTNEQIAADYKEFRGKCKQLCEAYIKEHPADKLRLVRGHVFIREWPSDPLQPHWWLEDEYTKIIDPSWRQFPSQPDGTLYSEWFGNAECSECGEMGKHREFGGTYFDYGNYMFCSDECAKSFVGL